VPTTRVLGNLCLLYDNGKWKRKRVHQVLPRYEKWFYFRRGHHLLLLHWAPHQGIWLVAERIGSEFSDPHTVTPRPEKKMPIKRRPGPTAGPAHMPEAKVTSVILAKLPALREWMVATTFDDGSARESGKLSLEIYGTSWCLMLRDPNNGLRLPVRGEDLDKTLLLAEQLLGVEEAPWERDNWLTEQLAKKRKKK